MSSYSVQALQEKLSRLSLSQDSIETLSLWILHHKAYAKTSVSLWLDNVLKADADHTLILMYLANDVLQNGRRKGVEIFHDLLKDPIKQAVALSRGKKIQTSVERMFRIWQERRVYDKAFIRELDQLIEPSRGQPISRQQPVEEQPSKEKPPELKLSLLEDAVIELRKFEGELKIKSSHMSHIRIDVSDTSSLSQLKDKSDGGKFSAEFEEASQKLQDYCECLGVEVNERINMVAMLTEAKSHLSSQLAEFQRTAKDHRELGAVVEEVRDKLQQRLKDLQRAQQTATSDPTAKEDITDVGDMEIESDTESQEGVTDVAMATSSAVPLQSVKRPPPAVNQPHPPVNQPRPPQQPVPPTAVLQVRGGFVNSQPTSLFQGPLYSHQQQPPLNMRAPPPTGAPFQPRPPQNSFQPAMARPQGVQRSPPRFPSAPGLMMLSPRPRAQPPLQPAARPQLMQGGARTPQVPGGVRPPRMQGPSQIQIGARPPQMQGPSQIQVGARPPQMQGPSQIQVGARPPQMQGPSQIQVGARPPQMQGPSQIQVGARPPQMQGPNVRPLQMQGGVRPLQTQGGIRPPQIQTGVRPQMQGPVPRPAQTQPSNIVYQTGAISTAPVMYSSAAPTPGNSVALSSAKGMQTPANSAVGSSQLPVLAGGPPTAAVPLNAQTQITGPAGKSEQHLISVGTQPRPQLPAPAILVSQSGGEGPSSLDERLKSLLAHKTFTKSLLPDYPDSGSEEAGSRPYSPSTTLTDKDKPYSPSNNLVISSTASPLEVDNDSVPSPPTEVATPEDASPSPQLNMDNPILKALYQHESEEGLKEHPATPSSVAAADPVPSHSHSPAPSSQPSSQKAAGSGSSSLFSAVDTGLLQSILTNVKSVAENTTAAARDRAAPVDPTRTPELTSLPPERQKSPAPVSASRPPPNPSAPLQPKSSSVRVKDIKITPTLTSLLDEIFPKLSRSLQERKRKPSDPEPSAPESTLPSAKAPRLDLPASQPSSDAPPVPRGPPVRQPPPTAGTRPFFPPPTSAGPPLRPQFAPRAPGVPMGPRAPRPLRPSLQQPPGRLPNAGQQLPPNRPPFFARPQARPERPPFQPNPNHVDHFAPKHPEEFSQVGMNFRPPLSQTGPIRNFESTPHPLRPPGPNFRAPLRPRFM